MKISLIRSFANKSKRQIACAKGLGLRKMHKVIEVKNTCENIGMINKIRFMIKIEE